MGKVLEVLTGRDSCAELDKLRDELDEFANLILKDYLDQTKRYCKGHSLSPNHTKNFYDSVWGTIEINEGEIFVLNSPVLQRLRDIKQLGLADLLYSSANHTRFSHTLGVLQTASSMWKQIERELQKKGVTADKDIEQIIRLAAIFHDCGHMFCSHASERFFQNDISFSRHSEIEKIRNHFKKKLQIKPSLTEIISVLIVCSEGVHDLLSILDSGFQNLEYNNNNQNVIKEKICCLILGFPYSKKTIPFAQIISGQIDSDKLDYLKRDSHGTGVPVAVDMSRVFQKLRMVQTKQEYQMLSEAQEDASQIYKLGIAPAAINTIDQLIISRYMMFENIYFHQKVLTAEEMLRYALRKLDKSTLGLFDSFLTIMQFKDAMVVNAHFEKAVYEIEADSFSITNKAVYDEACTILSNLNKRYLFKRCVSLTSENLTDIGQLGNSFYSKVFIDRNNDFQNIFLQQVLQEVRSAKAILGDEINFCPSTDILLITAPDISSVSLNSNIAIADKINRDRNMVFEADSWLKSRTTRKPQNYLVSYEEDRYVIYIATEKILFREYGLLINDSIIYDENDEKEIAKLKSILVSKGYYNDAYALIPDDDIKRHSSRVERLIGSWKAYERFDIDRGGRKPIDATFLSSYIKQFYRFQETLGDFDVFVRGCLELFENVKIITRNDIHRSLKNNLDSIKKDSGCTLDEIQICNLGTLQDGGSQISYQVNEVNHIYHELYEEAHLTVRKLEELTPQEIKPVLVFIEDAFSSARQITSMFETYMGIPVEQRQTAEVHVKELTSEMKEKLCQSKIYFSFIFYNKENEGKFLQRLRDLGIEDVHLIAHEEFPEGYFRRKDIQDLEAQETTKKYFEAAGKMLIHEKAFKDGVQKSNWDDNRINNSALGYNDDQQLIIFPWNTPTYTMTALWLASKKENWYPLFQRIDK